MAPPPAAFAVLLLLLGAASTRPENTTCRWAVDGCERSDEDAQCRVRLRRWCPCALKPRWRCKCRRERPCSDETRLVNVTEAQDMAANSLQTYDTGLETFCDLGNCSTLPRKCVNFKYYERLYGSTLLRICCYQTEAPNHMARILCAQVTKHKWCFFMLCGYHPKPTEPPTEPPKPWAPWSENDLNLNELESAGAGDKNDIFDAASNKWWLIVVLAVIMPCCISICFCSKKTTSNQTPAAAAAKPAAGRTVAVTEPMMPEPGQPVPQSRLPTYLRATLPDAPARCRVNLHEPE